jgi:hypothetical protein
MSTVDAVKYSSGNSTLYPVSSSHQGDRVGKVRLLHERPRPDLLQQLLFGDEMAGAADQRRQQIERLRRKRDCLSVAQQSVLRRVEPVRPECVHVALS